MRNSIHLRSLLSLVTHWCIVAPVTMCCLLFIVFHSTEASDMASTYSIHSTEIRDIAEVKISIDLAPSSSITEVLYRDTLVTVALYARFTLFPDLAEHYFHTLSDLQFSCVIHDLGSDTDSVHELDDPHGIR